MGEKSSKDVGPKGVNGSRPQSRKSKSAQSFGREFSLKEDLAIKRVFSSGKKFKGSCLSIYYYGEGELPLKVALKVSKLNGSAPRRNKIKRIIREVIRLNRALFEPIGNIVISARVNPELKSPYEIIKKDLMDFAGNH